MKEMIRILLVVFIFSFCAVAQDDMQAFILKLLQKPPESTPELRQKTFLEVWETVKTKHYDGTFNGVDWEKVREKYAPKVAKTEGNEQLTEVLNDMLNELGVSHNAVINRSEIAKGYNSEPADLGFKLKWIESQAVITSIDANSPSYNAGLRQGFVIKEFDGVLVSKIVEEKNRRTINGRVGKLLPGEIGTKVNLVYLNEAGKTKNATIERIKAKGDLIKLFGVAPTYVWVDSRKLDTDIGYISFSGFLGVDEKVVNAINSMINAPAIILDLRNNRGGNSMEANSIANMFFDQMTVFSKIKTRKGIEMWESGIALPSKNNFKGILVILVNKESSSASEALSSGLQDLGRATIVGETSTGSLLAGSTKVLLNGNVQMYTEMAPVTPKGNLIEGKGVVPDIEIKLTRKMLLKGGDPQLEAAVKFIKKKLTKKEK